MFTPDSERHDLGEYYTPDWLAAKICRKVIKKPLTDRVIDPACGSGTFLFHAVRLNLAAAANATTESKRRAQVACGLIAGIDIHPVAVIIARVTFLLALGDTLATRAGGVTVPVYLGDALQLNVRGMFMGEELVVIVPPKAGEGERKDLHFPKSVCEFPELSDEVLETIRIASEGNMRAKAFEARIKAVVADRGKTIPDFDLSVLRQTFEKLDALRKDGRDTIWSYVARNLSRPLHLSSAERRADVVVGNPPWLAFRYMSKEFQKRFKELAEGERVYVGGKLATQADLSALFFAKSVALYLREGGGIAFVMPLAALTRGQFEKFRTGAFHTKKVQFNDEPWTFDEDVQPLFPVPSCVLFAAAERGLSRPTPKTVTAYKGRLPLRDAHEDVADKYLKVTPHAPAPSEASYEGGSPYRQAFVNGATLYPRMLCLVEKPAAVSRLGSNPDAPLVKRVITR